MPFVAPKSNGPSSGAGGRSTFRPPWVKDDATSGKTNSTVKTPVPWAKKTTTTAEKENGEKPSSTTTSAKKATTPATNTSALKKTNDVAAKKPEPVKKIAAPVKKLPEPAKKATPAAAAAVNKKKPPTPSSSSEEETEEDEEEETEEEETEEEETEEEESEEESEEEEKETNNLTVEQKRLLSLKPTQTNQKKKVEDKSELQQRFTLEKPKLRPVGVKRDKSMNDDGDAGIDEPEEDERENRLRFKLEKPKLRHVKPQEKEKALPSKSSENILKLRPNLRRVSKVDELLKEPKEEPKPEFKTKTLRKTPSIKREPSIKNAPAPPPLPSLVPKAPPPPPPPLGAPGEKRSLSKGQKTILEKLKSRPRRRPDWSEMMKEVESGRKLRHVQCNDRSQPILTCKSMTKVDNKFIYETEKGNSHNKLLKQIQGGIRLKPTQTNDRSRPVLDGLRKFRRQMTIEEQLQKSQSKINMLGAEPSSSSTTSAAASTSITPAKDKTPISEESMEDASGDELDDIDKIRDDLQSTKQMLALELRNREAQERENKKLLARIKTLETELEREKSREKNLEYGSNVIVATMDPTPTSEQAYVNSLKREVEDARKASKEVEKNYHATSELYDDAKAEIEEQKRQIQLLERKLAQVLQGDTTPGTNRISFCFAYDGEIDNYYDGMDVQQQRNLQQGGGSLNGSRRPSDAITGRDSSPELELELSESDPDEPEEKKTERREKRLVKEVKVLRSKLTKLKVKQEAAKKEKDALKQAMKKNHVILKEENKKFKKLEKEVHKMAASLKLDEDEDEDAEEKSADEEDEDEEPEEAEAESESESEESESEESEAETESESEAEDASNADKKANLEPRVKKHESRLTAMKKCNVLLQANVDNLQDEITQVRTKAANLQAELNSVLQDLGL